MTLRYTSNTLQSFNKSESQGVEPERRATVFWDSEVFRHLVNLR